MSFPAPFRPEVGNRVRVIVEDDRMLGTVESMSQSSFDLNVPRHRAAGAQRGNPDLQETRVPDRGYSRGCLGGLIGWGPISPMINVSSISGDRRAIYRGSHPVLSHSFSGDEGLPISDLS